MADLSNLLGDVYGDPEPEPEQLTVAPVTPAAPAWADDHHLDAAFASWQPEPLTPVLAGPSPAEASPAAAPSAPLDDDLAAALSAALAEAPRTTAVAPPPPAVPQPEPVAAPPFVAPVEPAPAPSPAPVAELAPEPVAKATAPASVNAWQRTDDDILPRGAKKSGFRLR